MTTTTRRVFLSGVPAAAIGGVAWAQERTRPVTGDPMVDAVAQELFEAVRARPDIETIKRAARLFAAVAEQTGYAARIDALVRRPDAAQRVFAAMNDHERHHADRARVLALAPELVYVSPQAMPTRTMQDAEQAVTVFRERGFAKTLREMADTVPTDPARLDWWTCEQWGWFCLFWGVSTILVCLIPGPSGCAFWVLSEVAVCSWWYHCDPQGYGVGRQPSPPGGQ